MIERGTPTSWVWRAAVRLLVLLMVPVVVVATQGVGNAATTVYGPWKHVVAHTGVFDTSGWTCDYDVQYQVDSLTAYAVRVANLGCVKGWGDTPFDLEPEHSSLTLTFKGLLTGAAGSDCEVSTGKIYGTSTSFLSNRSATASGFSPWGTCQVDEVCYDFYLSWNAIPNQIISYCDDLRMGAPPSPVLSNLSGCADGIPISAAVSLIPSTSSYQITVQFSSIVAAKNWSAISYNSGGETLKNSTSSASTTMVFQSYTSAAVEGGNPLGVMLMRNDGVYAANAVNTNYRTVPTSYPTGGTRAGSYKGVTDPYRCSFWFGPKIANFSDSDLDEPVAPIGTAGAQTGSSTPPAPTTPVAPNPCNFQIGDPTTWLEGGMCAAVGLLGAIFGVLGDVVSALGDVLGAILDLPAAIMGFLSGILETLFIPSGDLWTDFQNDLQADADASNLGAWEDATIGGFDSLGGGGGTSGIMSARTVEPDGTTSGVESFGAETVTPSMVAPPGDTGGSNGCLGPGFSWNLLGTAGLDQTIHPFEACDGNSAELASWSHLICTMLICLFGFIRIMESITSSMGLVKQASLMSRFDWGNDHVSIKR